jgi:DNA-binding NarL/FixJ family response regulator
VGVDESGDRTRIAGRAREREVLRTAVRDASEGSPRTVLVHGEAGVGKTTLVTAVAEQSRAAGHSVLWGRCLRFGAASSPYLPFISALHGWLADGHATEELGLELLEGARDGDGAAPSGRALHLIDGAVVRLAQQAPVLLVVDDLQWADVSSLDALAYLIAGSRPQPLTILVTYRDEGIPEGDTLHEWLADMVRMPGVIDLPLRRFSVDETAEQLRNILGGRADPGLVSDVWQRSGGNAYLAELLTRDLDPSAASLPDDLPDALRTALLARWHSLSTPARRLTQVLAVAGRPAAPSVLAAVAGSPAANSRGADSVDAGSALAEARHAGVTHQDRTGLTWFRHPLLADVLYATLSDAEAGALHRAFVEVLLAQGPHSTRSHGDLALHYAGAGMVDEAFEQCLLAASEARATAAFPEAAVLMERAADLWPEVSEPVRSRSGSWGALLCESASLFRAVDDLVGSLAQLDRALEVTDEQEEPLVVARALRLAGQVAWTGGFRPDQPVEEMRRAVELSAAVPDSVEHALSLADLADAEFWSGGRTEDFTLHAQLAVAVARRAGDDSALSYVLGIQATTLMDDDRGEACAREALRLGLEASYHEYAALAAIALFNTLEASGRFEEAAEVLLAAHRRQTGFHGLTQLLSVYAGGALLPLGRIEEAKELFRDVLASRARGIIGIQARENAAIVAVRRGELEEAAMHLERVRELSENFEELSGMHGPGATAEYLMATGRPGEVLALLERTIGMHAQPDPKYADTLLLWAARAAAALPRSRREAALERVLEARARARVPAFSGEGRDPGQRAVHALFDAEVALCRQDPDVVDRWRRAVSLADAAGLRQAAEEARLRLAEALLGVRERDEAAELLRTTHARAEEMGALRLRGEVAEVAAAARISLAEPVSQPAKTASANGLTRREREILGHLVAGRSYREIAGALFISEKTVSVHVSNLLRKTGTTSRVEAAAWARRSGAFSAG